MSHASYIFLLLTNACCILISKWLINDDDGRIVYYTASLLNQVHLDFHQSQDYFNQSVAILLKYCDNTKYNRELFVIKILAITKQIFFCLTQAEISAFAASSPLKSVIFSSLNSPFTTAVPSQCGAGLETV